MLGQVTKYERKMAALEAAQQLLEDLFAPRTIISWQRRVNSGMMSAHKTASKIAAISADSMNGSRDLPLAFWLMPFGGSALFRNKIRQIARD